jgi:hypothetical protein
LSPQNSGNSPNPSTIIFTQPIRSMDLRSQA